MGFEVFGVFDEGLEDVDVLLLPDSGEGLVDHAQVELFAFQLVDEVVL